LVKKVPAFYGKQDFIAVTEEKKTVTDPAGHSPNLHFLHIPFNMFLPPAFSLQVLRPKCFEHIKKCEMLSL
jgi:hypothetical protein